MKTFNKIFFLGVLSCSAVLFNACEQERLEDALEIADGAGTLTQYKAYSLDSVAGSGEVYGRAVFWLGLDGKTLLQISLQNVAKNAVFQSSVLEGATSSPGAMVESLYNIENNGEIYDPYTGPDDVDNDDDDTNDASDDINLLYGEFSTSKYYTMKSPTFFDDLDTMNIHISISDGADLISIGDLGINANPVESN